MRTQIHIEMTRKYKNTCNTQIEIEMTWWTQTGETGKYIPALSSLQMIYTQITHYETNKKHSSNKLEWSANSFFPFLVISKMTQSNVMLDNVNLECFWVANCNANARQLQKHPIKWETHQIRNVYSNKKGKAFLCT